MKIEATAVAPVPPLVLLSTMYTEGTSSNPLPPLSKSIRITRPSPSTTVSSICAPTGSTIATLGVVVYPCPGFNTDILPTLPSLVKFALNAALIGLEPVGSSTYTVGAVVYPNPFAVTGIEVICSLASTGVPSFAPPG